MPPQEDTIMLWRPVGPVELRLIEESDHSAFLQGYDIRQAGGRKHLEYWIPAEDLPDFNRAIVGRIEAVTRYDDIKSDTVKSSS